ncbi:hypothetical protein ACQP3L_31575, partial [Escherichia coli]
MCNFLYAQSREKKFLLENVKKKNYPPVTLYHSLSHGFLLIILGGAGGASTNMWKENRFLMRIQTVCVSMKKI